MRRWLKKSDVNNELTIPIARVVANPRTALDPKKIRTTAAIIVVMFESKIVHRAFENPVETAFFGSTPALSSSLILSNMITLASTAIPTERIRPAMPVYVRVDPNPPNVAIIITRFITSAMSAIRPLQL